MVYVRVIECDKCDDGRIALLANAKTLKENEANIKKAKEMIENGV